MKTTNKGQTKSPLTSYDYARLIQFLGQTCFDTYLNKTQILKILFYVYGVYLARHGGPLFSEEPRAWPYGPVFPNAYEQINPYEQMKPFDEEMKERYRENPEALNIAYDAVKMLHAKSARKLTDWSHKIGSPWYETIYKQDKNGERTVQGWNTPIDQNKIKSYFEQDCNVNLNQL